MNSSERDDYAKYRMEKSRETLEAAELLIRNGNWNSAVNRLYYAAYYAITGLLVKAGIETKTHTGVKTQFFLHFVKTGKISMSLGKLYTDLFDWRQKGDYGDFFDFTEADVAPFLEPIKQLIDAVIEEINKTK